MKGAGHTPNTDFFPENMIDHSSSPNFLTTGSRIINYRQHGKQTTAWQRSNSCNSRGSTDSMSERYYWNPLLLSQIVTQKKQFLWPLVWSQKHIVSNAQLQTHFTFCTSVAKLYQWTLWTSQNKSEYGSNMGEVANIYRQVLIQSNPRKGLGMTWDTSEIHQVTSHQAR